MIVIAAICLTYPSDAELQLPTVEELRPFLPESIRNKRMTVRFSGEPRRAQMPDGRPVTSITYNLRLE